MPSSNRFDNNMKPSRKTKVAAVALVATAAIAAGAVTTGAATSIQAVHSNFSKSSVQGGFKGVG